MSGSASDKLYELGSQLPHLKSDGVGLVLCVCLTLCWVPDLLKSFGSSSQKDASMCILAITSGIPPILPKLGSMDLTLKHGATVVVITADL